MCINQGHALLCRLFTTSLQNVKLISYLTSHISHLTSRKLSKLASPRQKTNTIQHQNKTTGSSLQLFQDYNLSLQSDSHFANLASSQSTDRQIRTRDQIRERARNLTLLSALPCPALSCRHFITPSLLLGKIGIANQPYRYPRPRIRTLLPIPSPNPIFGRSSLIISCTHTRTQFRTWDNSLADRQPHLSSGSFISSVFR